MRVITYLLILIIIILGITFAALNHAPVTINYYIGQNTLPLSLLLVMSFVIGCFLGLLVACWVSFKFKIKNYRLRQQLKIAEKEIENLRAIPLQDRR